MMQTRHTNRPPQTLKQAKAEYKKYGPRISSQEQRHLERGAELWRRAEKIKETDKRRKKVAEKKRIREEKMQEERKRLNIKAPEPWISPRQTRVVNFFRCDKAGGNRINLHLSSKLDSEEVDTQEEKDHQSRLNCMEEDDTEPETEAEDSAGEAEKSISKHQMQLQRSFEDFSFDEDTMAILDKQIALHSQPTSAAKPPSTSNDTVLQLDLANFPSDFFPSNTQVHREICISEPPVECTVAKGSETLKSPHMDTDQHLDIILSTQDVELSSQDLDGVSLQGSRSARSTSFQHAAMPEGKQDARSAKELMPPPLLPVKVFYSSMNQANELQAESEPWDFELSTQDCRDMVG